MLTYMWCDVPGRDRHAKIKPMHLAFGLRLAPLKMHPDWCGVCCIQTNLLSFTYSNAMQTSWMSKIASTNQNYWMCHAKQCAIHQHRHFVMRGFQKNETKRNEKQSKYTKLFLTPGLPVCNTVAEYSIVIFEHLRCIIWWYGQVMVTSMSCINWKLYLKVKGLAHIICNMEMKWQKHYRACKNQRRHKWKTGWLFHIGMCEVDNRGPVSISQHCARPWQPRSILMVGEAISRLPVSHIRCWWQTNLHSDSCFY